MAQIDIMNMLDPKEQKRKALFNGACSLMKQLKNKGKGTKEIEAIINKINLPFDIHLCIMGHFSEICRHGRLLTKTEKQIGIR